MHYFKLKYLILLLLAACAPRKEMYVVSVVEKSSISQPVWLSRFGDGGFPFIGEDLTNQ